MRIYSPLLLFLFIVISCSAQDTNRHGIIFYNVENLMDTIDNPEKRDNEFLPESEKKWNTERYETKLSHLSEVISSAGNQLPTIIGLSEVENMQVVTDLASTEKLSSGYYAVVQFDSPDERGIDCALMYQKKLFKLNNAYPIPVTLPDNNGGPTRDILYVKGYFNSTSNKEAVHIFINHWPSRYKGEELTRPRRIAAANVLRMHIDSLNQEYKDPVIIIMGDMNDTPFDESTMVTLGASINEQGHEDEALVNLTARFQKENQGSYNYKGNWQSLDQLIVSEVMLNEEAKLQVDKNQIRFIRNDFQMYNSDKYGPTPNRTYGGPNYYGGYSDHLPVYMEIVTAE